MVLQEQLLGLRTQPPVGMAHGSDDQTSVDDDESVGDGWSHEEDDDDEEEEEEGL